MNGAVLGYQSLMANKAVTFEPGLDFTGQFVDLGQAIDFSTVNQLTIVAELTAAVGSNQIFAQYQSSGSKRVIDLYYSNSNLRLSVSSNGGNSAGVMIDWISTNPVADGTTKVICAVMDLTQPQGQKIRFYVDGAEISATASGGRNANITNLYATTAVPFLIGTAGTVSSHGSVFTGTMLALGWSESVFSLNQIQNWKKQNYHHFYDFNKAAGGVLPDQAGLNDGIIIT